jgi:pilus assembly protein Flp/PilA
MEAKMTRTQVCVSLRQFARDRSGATAIEYALIASCISIAIASAASLLGSTLATDYYGKVLTAVQDAGKGGGGD